MGTYLRALARRLEFAKRDFRMRAIRWITQNLLRCSSTAAVVAAVLLVPLLIASSAMAQEGPQWRLNLDDAEKLAMQTNRLVLIHFWAPWCHPCRALEANVFSQPGVGPAIESRFVPVKINLDDQAYSATARLYEIQQIPTDVVITPSGRLIARIPCSQDPRIYIAQLMRAAGDPTANAIVAAPGYPAQPAAANSTAGLSMYSSGNPNGYAARPAMPGPADPGAAYGSATASGAVATASAASIAQAPTNAAPPPVPPRPPLGLDGFCPVTLIERHHATPSDPHCWVQGDPRWGVVHRGTVYLFAGPEEQKRFLADPDRFSPALSGNDPIIAFDQGRLVQGTRQFGTFYGDRVYLFSSAENLAKFAQKSDIAQHYADDVRQAEASSGGSMH
jgi:thiol-disulfide isomerase/thioredoxin